MNETCMKHALNTPDISGCPYCRIDELEQHKADSEDMLTAQINSMVNQLDRAEDRVMELEWQNSKLVEALETLSKLGNGDKVGNSIGNQIATAALKEVRGA